jgi:hypothetical protein
MLPVANQSISGLGYDQGRGRHSPGWFCSCSSYSNPPHLVLCAADILTDANNLLQGRPLSPLPYEPIPHLCNPIAAHDLHRPAFPFNSRASRRALAVYPSRFLPLPFTKCTKTTSDHLSSPARTPASQSTDGKAVRTYPHNSKPIEPPARLRWSPRFLCHKPPTFPLPILSLRSFRLLRHLKTDLVPFAPLRPSALTLTRLLPVNFLTCTQHLRLS